MSAHVHPQNIFEHFEMSVCSILLIIYAHILLLMLYVLRHHFKANTPNSIDAFVLNVEFTDYFVKH